MELIRPLSSSAVRFVTTPGGISHVFLPELVKKIQERYQFWQHPKSPEEFDLNSGAKFKTGVFEGTLIDTLSIYRNGLSVEGRADNAKLDAIIDDILAFTGREFNIHFEPSEPLSKGFASAVEVRGDPSIAQKLAAFSPVLERLTLMVAKYGFTITNYEVTGFIAQSEPEAGEPTAPSRFIFEHRAGTRLDSGVYYSEAPVSTQEHMELLQMIEAILTNA